MCTWTSRLLTGVLNLQDLFAPCDIDCYEDQCSCFTHGLSWGCRACLVLYICK